MSAKDVLQRLALQTKFQLVFKQIKVLRLKCFGRNTADNMSAFFRRRSCKTLLWQTASSFLIKILLQK